MDISRKTIRLANPTPSAAGRAPATLAARIASIRSSGLRDRLTVLLVRHRQTVLMAAVGVVLLMEISENVLTSLYGERIPVIFDAAVYVLILPFCVWFLLSLLESSLRERDRAKLDSSRRAAFSQRLGEALTWEDLTREIVTYAHQTAPRAQVTLLANQPGRAPGAPAASCSSSGQVTLYPPASLDLDELSNAGFPPHNAAPGGTAPHCFDLPLIRCGQEIGLLRLEYPQGSDPGSKETQALKNTAAVMTLALEGGILQNLAAEQARASEHQRQKIAQHLHDTLAQNISYLRLKLDQLTGDNSIREIGMVLEELEHMRATANEAYQQVRGTLDELHTAPGQDLASLLEQQGQVISQRAGFNLRLHQAGAPYPLPPALSQGILYITREALHNVEKHARAGQVCLQILWLEHELILKIADDGVGFDPSAAASGSHYGLWIMHNRAQEMGGGLKIQPAEEQGMEVTVWVPRPRYPLS